MQKEKRQERGRSLVGVRVRVRTVGVRVSRTGGERNRERVRDAGPLRREEGYAAEQGGQRVLEGLRRQECIGTFNVYSNAGGDLDVWNRV